MQHALRAFTPRDQKAVRTAAQTFRPNPNLDTEQTITEMGVGEALVSTLEAKGTPGIVQRTLICPPHSRIGPASDSERDDVMRQSPLAGRYDKMVDRDSAHEELTARLDKALKETEAAEEAARREKEARRNRPRTSNRQSVGEAFTKSIARAIGSRVGRQIVRGVLGSIFKGR